MGFNSPRCIFVLSTPGWQFWRGSTELNEQSLGFLESTSMQTIFARFVNDEFGATAIEYGLIAAIVGVGIIAGLGTLKNSLSSMFANVSTNLNVN